MSQEKQEGEFSLKGKKTKPKNLGKTQEGPIKVNLSTPVEKQVAEEEKDVTRVVIGSEEKQPEENANTEQETTEVVADKQTGVVQEVGEEVSSGESTVQDEGPIIQEITEEEVEKVEKLENELDKAIDNKDNSGTKLPENIEKLVLFMEETGGSISDYVRLNADYSNVDNNTLLKEYYKKTKPYLDSEDISLLIEDFSYDEDIDEERDIRKKKLAFKEEVAKAKNFLEETKSKYYDEIKLRPGVTQDQQKATDFFNRYNEEQEAVQLKHKDFISRTKNLLNNDFEGFDFKVSDKKFRYSIKNPTQVAENQSDITNFIKTFLNDKNEITDTKGYHKALYAARNADTIAQHFYEQGKADAVKDVMAKSKNISNEPRQTASGDVFVNGFKVKAISGLDSSKLKIKTKKFN